MMVPPLSLYVHLPWCVHKCPYCDFNSHVARTPLPFADYVDALLVDLDADLQTEGGLPGRTLQTVFFGGGTPSLFPPAEIERILHGVRSRLAIAEGAEITLEANPGAIEQAHFSAYRQAGVNRLSLGIQSFNDVMLQRLGRIHSAAEARRAIDAAQQAGFDNLNLDLMYALPGQNIDGAMDDIQQALGFAPAHISHYQLTLEPGTPFGKQPPPAVPDSDLAWAMQESCQARLAEVGYIQYEVSAYSKPGREARHNLNYWGFGDYLGIGAGAHGKISRNDGHIVRRAKRRNPKLYMGSVHQPDRLEQCATIPAAEIPFEFMLNALRLIDGVPRNWFAQRSGLNDATITGRVADAIARGWMSDDPTRLQATPFGQRFLNDLIALFLP